MQPNITRFEYFCYLQLVDISATLYYNIHTNRNAGGNYEYCRNKEICMECPRKILQ